MAKGRKRKSGPREKNGRASRRGQSRIDKGTERAQETVSRYGLNGGTAIGRAFSFGLFGRGEDSKDILNIGESITLAYWAAYEVGKPGCCLAIDVSSNKVYEKAYATEQERQEIELKREKWLNGKLGLIGRMGTPRRRAFDGLTLDRNTDTGPAWLDRILEQRGSPNDRDTLALAIDVLRECAGIMEMAEAA